MASGRAALDEMIRSARALGTMVPDAAPAVARVLDSEVRTQIAQGTGPDGRPWKPTQAGNLPLRNAGKSVTTRAIDGVVLMTVVGVEARHHLGAVRGKVRRPIIPSSRIPDPMARAITRVYEERFGKITGGAGG